MTISTIRMFLTITLATTLVACGGGGSNSAFYGGVWRFQGVEVINDCNLENDPTVSLELNINQLNNDVIATVGSIHFEGKTNNDDGFTIIHEAPPEANCDLASAFSFKDASDGNADVGFAVITKCRTLTCTVAYSGSAKRSSQRSFNSKPAQDSAVLFQELIKGTRQVELFKQAPIEPHRPASATNAAQLAEQLLNRQ